MIEVDLIQPHDMRVLTTPLFQEPEERDLALETPQAVGAEAKLKDAPVGF